MGVLNPSVFDPMTQTLGAADGCWCLSRTGKKGENKTFTPYADKLHVGDAVGVEVDMKRWGGRVCISWCVYSFVSSCVGERAWCGCVLRVRASRVCAFVCL